MDDRVYCCPGATDPIDRAVHLGRLANFFPDCRGCVHRDDTGTLSPGKKSRLVESQVRAKPPALFSGTGVSGVYWNEVTPSLVFRLAQAFAGWLERRAEVDTDAPVLIASDGRPLTADLIAALSEGLRASGSNVVDLGFTTAPGLAYAISRAAAAGGVYLGNEAGGPHTVSLRFWEHGAEPLTSSALQELRQLLEATIPQRARRMAALSRSSIDEAYLGTLEPYYHALRPLHFVLDCGSRPFWKYLERLTRKVACRFTPSCPDAGRLPERRVGRPGLAAELDSEVQQRRRLLGQQVLKQQAHGGMWVDGDGERCEVLDERGCLLSADELSKLLSNPISDQSGNRVESASPDALRALTLLLSQMSQSDRPLSSYHVGTAG